MSYNISAPVALEIFSSQCKADGYFCTEEHNIYYCLTAESSTVFFTQIVQTVNYYFLKCTGEQQFYISCDGLHFVECDLKNW